MKKLGIGLAIAIASVGAARAADLPTKKGVAPPRQSIALRASGPGSTSTAADCPLSYGPFTVYGDVDVGVGYETNGAPYNAAWNNGVNSFITKQQLRLQMAVDAERPQPVGRRPQDEPKPGPAWAGRLVADRHGRDRIQSLLWLSGRRPALAGPEQRQGARAARARTPIRAAPANGTTRRAFIGLSNKTYGTLTGRPRQHPVAGRDQFLRSDGRLLRLLAPGLLRLLRRLRRHRGRARQYGRQIPGGNPRILRSTERISASAAWCNGAATTRATAPTAFIRARPALTSTCFRESPYGGVLSMDFIGSWAKDVVNVGTFTGTLHDITKGPFAGQTACTSGIPDVLQQQRRDRRRFRTTPASCSTAKYKVQALTVFGGYGWHKQANPSDDFLNGFQTIGGWNVPATIPSSVNFQAVSSTRMDQLHQLQCHQDRSLLLARRQIRDHASARRDRRLLLPATDRL